MGSSRRREERITSLKDCLPELLQSRALPEWEKNVNFLDKNYYFVYSENMISLYSRCAEKKHVSVDEKYIKAYLLNKYCKTCLDAFVNEG